MNRRNTCDVTCWIGHRITAFRVADCNASLSQRAGWDFIVHYLYYGLGSFPKARWFFIINRIAFLAFRGRILNRESFYRLSLSSAHRTHQSFRCSGLMTALLLLPQILPKSYLGPKNIKPSPCPTRATLDSQPTGRQPPPIL